MKKIFLRSFIISLLLLLLSCSREDKKVVVCWGDSLTASQSEGIKGVLKEMIGYHLAYPEILQKELGDNYEVINCGVGSEPTLTIMARQGAYPMALAHDVELFPDGTRNLKIFLGNNDVPAFISTYNGKAVAPLLNGGWDNPCARVNPCRVGGAIIM